MGLSVQNSPWTDRRIPYQ